MTHLARVAIVASFPILLLRSFPAAAEVYVEVRGPEEAARLTAEAPAAKLATGAAVVLPYYRAKVVGAPGENTLFAVRNNGSTALAVRFSYFAAGGGDPVERDTVLPAHGVRTVNVGTLTELPRSGGFATGFMVAEALDGNLPTAVLSGDYFRIDGAGTEANGGALVPAAATACRRWSHRFLGGGGFDGGTRIAFLALDAPPQGATLSGNVYNEAGEMVSVVHVTSDEAAFELSDSDLDLPVDFGSIDWIFQGEGHGVVSTTFTARRSGISATSSSSPRRTAA